MTEHEGEKPLALLWTDDEDAYMEAVVRVGLVDRYRFEHVPREALPDDSQLASAELMVAWTAPPGILARMPQLRWIQAPTVGVEGWLRRPDLCPAIALSCARGSHRVQMPEAILGALFHLTKHMASFAESQREGRWARRLAIPLAGKTLGILGLGAVGAELARKAAALEMRVIGTRRSGAPVPHVQRVHPPEELGQVLAESDFVVLLLPLTPQSENLMNAERLRSMKRSAWLLNFARGGLIVDEDLVAAVQSGVIAGAMLDVFRTEPLPAQHPFWRTPGITVLPHMGGGHPDRPRMVADLFADNLGRWSRGEPLSGTVDRERGY